MGNAGERNERERERERERARLRPRTIGACGTTRRGTGRRLLTGSFIALVRRSDSSAERSIFFSSLCIACENRPSSLSSENMPGSTASADMLPLVSVDIQGAGCRRKRGPGRSMGVRAAVYCTTSGRAFGWLMFCIGHGGHAEAQRRGGWGWGVGGSPRWGVGRQCVAEDKAGVTLN